MIGCSISGLESTIWARGAQFVQSDTLGEKPSADSQDLPPTASDLQGAQKVQDNRPTGTGIALY